jgi:hypothetical protein
VVAPNPVARWAMSTVVSALARVETLPTVDRVTTATAVTRGYGGGVAIGGVVLGGLRSCRDIAPGCFEFAGQAFWSGPADVGGPDESLEGPDDPGGHIELSASDAMASTHTGTL